MAEEIVQILRRAMSDQDGWLAVAMERMPDGHRILGRRWVAPTL